MDQEITRVLKLSANAEHNEALILAQKLISCHPVSPAVHNVTGVVYAGLGQLETSLKSFQKAVELKTNYVEALSNHGCALNSLNRCEEAIPLFNRALHLNPRYSQAYSERANALFVLGKVEEAAESISELLGFSPDNAAAHNTLGLLQARLGKSKEAGASFSKAIQIKPEFEQYWVNLKGLLDGRGTDSGCIPVPHALFELLEEQILLNPPVVIFRATSLIRNHPVVYGELEAVHTGQSLSQVELSCKNLSSIPLLMQAMRLCPIPDIAIENLLVHLRKSILTAIEHFETEVNIAEFQVALAHQSFLNEYIFKETAAETDMVQTLERDIASAIEENTSVSPSKIACLASYRPLNSYVWAAKVLENNHFQSLVDLFQVQIKDVNEEQIIRSKIGNLQPIENATSVAVRQQYEESPYPRWGALAVQQQLATIQELASTIPLQLDVAHHQFPEKLEILVAGCGTGRHAALAASRFLGSNVLAIDLSLSSLSFASRKTQELGITNIEYLQADILDARNLGRKFDLIESVGVLHHMENPLEGWRSLTDCLKPGGLMKIGLYSETARAPVVQIRDIIAARNVGDTPSEIKNFRGELVGGATAGRDLLNWLESLNDFYSLSEFRDLLFHVQEHRYTIPMIENQLENLGLKFSGFECHPAIKRQFTQMYPATADQFSLRKWHEYETLKSDTFKGMYIFWVQKPW